jgi:hypothetical protein
MGITPPTPPEKLKALAEKLYAVSQKHLPPAQRVAWLHADATTKNIFNEMAEAANAFLWPPGPTTP